MLSQSKTVARPNHRRFFQLRLRTFLVLVTAFAIWLGCIVVRSERQRTAIAKITKSGGEVVYRYQLNADESLDLSHEPPIPQLLVNLLGIDFFCRPSLVFVNNQEALNEIGSLKQIDLVSVNGIAQVNLTPLSSVRVKRLSLFQCGKFDVKPIGIHPELEYFWISKCSFDSATELSQLPNLRYLMFAGSAPAFDATILAPFKKLQFIQLGHMIGRDDEVKRLRELRPDCDIRAVLCLHEYGIDY